ncbi:hypothetical protein ABIA39_008656 [Nocardia sp. GAS34]|uniref:SMI1/KNR4 family protein n=2 Tax=unclassified Nocardia TaxID=2637762 RepID=UPI003D22825C
MSPTPTPRPSSLQELERLRQEMLHTEYTTPDTFAGCSTEEIQQVVDAASPIQLPDEYIAYLQLFGRGSGTLFRGSNICYPAPLESRESAEDIASDPEETLTLENRFFFGDHQGYTVYFFEQGSDAVFGYAEGHPEVLRLAETFTQWLWETFRRSQAIRADSERLRAETAKKRAQMRAEGKL